MSHCPSCGRYVGPRDACPYCAARISRRMSIRAVKLAAIAFATLGLAVLWYVAVQTDVPLVSIGRIRAGMNLAYVRVAGCCTDVPSYDPQTGYLSFWLDDGTGELYVSSYRSETETLVEGGRVPALGDRVALAGTLRVREDFSSLTLNAPEELVITRAEPERCPIGAIAPDQTYRRVSVRGQVRRIVEPYPGLTLITLRDETGAIDVAVDADLVAISGVTPTVEVGQSVEVLAAVSDYKGTAQLVPASTSDIISLDDHVPLAAQRFVAELARRDAGKWVAVRGMLTGVDTFSEGVKLALDDGSGVVTVLLWDDLYRDLAREMPPDLKLAPGARVEAQGELAEYRGELELIPELPADVRVVTPPSPVETASEGIGSAVPTRPPPGPSAAPEAQVTPIGAVQSDRVGEEVTVEGTVVDAVSFSHGFKLTLEEDAARVVLLIWDDVYDDCADRTRLDVGATLRATGQVSQYKEELQIEPGSGADVIVRRGPGASVERRDIGSIGMDDEGQRLMIEGQVDRSLELSGGVKVLLRDDTLPSGEEIPVVIWQPLLERIANNAGLSMPGCRVQVTGTVQVYEGDLEVVPALPHDVAVLRSP